MIQGDDGKAISASLRIHHLPCAHSRGSGGTTKMDDNGTTLNNPSGNKAGL